MSLGGGGGRTLRIRVTDTSRSAHGRACADGRKGNSRHGGTFGIRHRKPCEFGYYRPCDMDTVSEGLLYGTKLSQKIIPIRMLTKISAVKIQHRNNNNILGRNMSRIIFYLNQTGHLSRHAVLVCLSGIAGSGNMLPEPFVSRSIKPNIL